MSTVECKAVCPNGHRAYVRIQVIDELPESIQCSKCPERAALYPLPPVGTP